MGHAWFLRTVLLLFALPGGWFKPAITPDAPHLVILKGGQLELRCHDDAEASMGSVQWLREKGRKIDAELKDDGSSVILLTSTQNQHMGRYTCENTKTGERSSVYVYVKDLENAFVRSMVNGLLVREGENCTIPCLVTDPAVNHLSLLTCTGTALPAGLTYITNPERGITIRNVSKAFDGCYVCAGQMDEKPVKSNQYTLNVRLVPETVPAISLSIMENVILIQDQDFELTCSAININHDFLLSWSIPSEAIATEEFNSKIVPGSRGYQRSVTLKFKSVKMSDSGVYQCSAKNEKGVSMASVNLEVYEQGFINLTEGADSVVQVREGESLTLSVEMISYPKPSEIYWTYNNEQLQNTSEHVITLHNQQYRYISELRLVRIHGSEGGIYTFSANHTYASVNHSFTVHVICKPVIVSQEGPVDGQVRCVASGYPVPKISWYYCEPPHTRCSLLLNATQADEDVAVVTVSGSEFGRSEVESRLNISKGKFHTLECVAKTQGEHAYTLFSISERTVPHKLFTPLLSGVVSTAVLLSLIVVVLLFKYMQKPKYEIHWKVIDSFDGNNYTYIDPTQLPYDPKWEFPRERLRFGKILGSGAFGKVVAATAYGLLSADTVTTVAVKMLKPSAHSTEKEALMSELKVLSYIGNHMNIVNLLGACTVGGPTLVITEFCCYGDMLNFLRRKRDAFFSSKTGDGYYKNLLSQTQPSREGTDNGYMPMRSYQKRSNQTGKAHPKKEQAKYSHFYHKLSLFYTFQSVSSLSEWCDDKDDLSLDTEDLLSFSYQVAKGMDFLTSKNCIHRDLAARNVLLTQGRVAKICDFGLARDITRDSSYVLRGNARLPVKWMSPESLFACVYTFESDVWSYGILLWEIFSLGNTPYPGIPVGSTFYKMIQDGYRMSEPEFAPIEIYEVMRWCWSADPLKRPTFKKLVERTELLLSETTKHDYLNLSTSGSCEAFVPPDLQRAQRLSSVGSSTASTQPLLQATNEVFLEHQSI
ncbi:KIT proto-oncogene, receptor tyrosine kinase b isoform X1 [Megalobrama amblycephala]|uniref:KIT proto-oncogene, receptor tyrosine kinase b isoform X1 n=1 Tax=Megalobrama amblycephala TaxID=75352 RepID=UPI002014270F|nr:KIT proto-oncogene, receptor tyrosine kinase b isoform X1 [Megalobrama amblycephala]